MPTRCTEPATYSGIRNSWPVPTRAGTPDSPGRRFGPPPARPSRSSRPPTSPKPDCASVPPSGLAAAIRLQFRLGSEIGIFRAIGVAARRARLALLVARKTAIAAACAEIAALDAEWIILRRGRDSAWRRGGAAHHQRPHCPSHRDLRSCFDRRLQLAEQTGPAASRQFT